MQSVTGQGNVLNCDSDKNGQKMGNLINTVRDGLNNETYLVAWLI